MTKAMINRRFARFPAGAVICASLCLFVSTADAAEPPVTAIAFAPHGKSVVVGSQAGLVVCSWPELMRLKEIDTTVTNVHDLEFSPDGHFLAVAGGIPSEEGLVEVFTWPSGKSLYSCIGHTDSVFGVAWMSDSSFVTASLDHDVVLWNAKTHKPVGRFTGHSRGVTALCILSNQQILVSAGIDQNLRVWSIKEDKMIRSLNNHTKAIHDVALRPRTGLPMIASVSSDRTVRLWQPTIGRMVRFAHLKSIPLAVDWLPSGSHVVVATADGHVRLVDPDTVEIVQDLPAVDGWAYSLGVHPTDGSLLIGGRNGQLKRIIPEIPSP